MCIKKNVSQQNMANNNAINSIFLHYQEKDIFFHKKHIFFFSTTPCE